MIVDVRRTGTCTGGQGEVAGANRSKMKEGYPKCKQEVVLESLWEDVIYIKKTPMLR